MAKVLHKHKEYGENFEDSNGYNPSWELRWPKGISYWERRKLYKLGEKDARSGIATINEYNELSSVYCESLIHSANQRIESEWKKCNEFLFDLISEIASITSKIDSLDQSISDLTLEKNKAVASVRDLHFDGDDVVSEHLSNRRKNNRENRVCDFYDIRIDSLNDELETMELKLIPMQSKFAEAEEIARCHEQLTRTDYMWRMTAYAYGASKYIKITPDVINDNSLSDTPAKQHNELFRAVKSSFVYKEKISENLNDKNKSADDFDDLDDKKAENSTHNAADKQEDPVRETDNAE